MAQGIVPIIDANLPTSLANHLQTQISTGDVHGLRVTNGRLEFFNGVGWQKIKGEEFVSDEQSVVLDSDSPTVTIPIPNFNSATNALVVVKNSVVLSKGIDYSVSGSVVSKITGTWLTGDLFTFIVIQTVQPTSDLTGTIFKQEEFVATNGQQVFNLTTGAYNVATNTLAVYVNGNRQPNSSFSETTNTSFTFTNGVSVGDKVLVEWHELIDISGVYTDRVYDQVITNQVEFMNLISSPNWLGAKAVAFVGDGGLTTFKAPANSGIVVPFNVFQIHGFKKATIELIDCLSPEEDLPYFFGYTEPASENGYGIRDMTLKISQSVGQVEETETQGFRYFQNMDNCTVISEGTTRVVGFTGCIHLNNCNAAIQSASLVVGFVACENMCNCAVYGKAPTFYGIDRSRNLVNCTVELDSSVGGVGLYNCEFISNTTVVLRCPEDSVTRVIGFERCRQISNSSSRTDSGGSASAIPNAFYNCHKLSSCVGAAYNGSNAIVYNECSGLTGCTVSSNFLTDISFAYCWDQYPPPPPTLVSITTNWVGSQPPYTQTIAVDDIYESDLLSIGPVYSDVLATALLQKEAWNMVSKIVPGYQEIVFTCFEDKPSIAIPVKVKVMS